MKVLAPKGRHQLIVATKKQILVIDATTGGIHSDTLNDDITAICLSEDGSAVFLATKKVIHKFNTSPLSHQAEVKLPKKIDVTLSCFDLDKKLLAVGKCKEWFVLDAADLTTINEWKAKHTIYEAALIDSDRIITRQDDILIEYSIDTGSQISPSTPRTTCTPGQHRQHRDLREDVRLRPHQDP